MIGEKAYVRRIGLVTMPTGPIKKKKGVSYITESNIKWFAERGIDILPIPYDTKRPESYFKKIHGLYLQGGPVYDAKYMHTVQRLLELAEWANDHGEHFPVWGTCHGLQTMLMIYGHLALDGSDLGDFNAQNSYIANLCISVTEQRMSHMLSTFSPQFLKYLRKGEHVFFKHEHGLSPREFYANGSLSHMFRLLASTVDRDGKPYVSLIEGKKYPFYGAQFHPELVPALEPFRDFFVEEVMKNDRPKIHRRIKTFKRLYTSRTCATRRNKEYYKVFNNSNCYFFD
jgi:gamma-glutamyl hydrolase